MPPPFRRSPLLGLLDLATLRDRALLLASPSLTSVPLAIPAWKERTVQTATSAVKVLEVRLISPCATMLAVVGFRAAPPSATVPALRVPHYDKLQKYQPERSERQQSSDADARPNGYRKRPPRALRAGAESMAVAALLERVVLGAPPDPADLLLVHALSKRHPWGRLGDVFAHCAVTTTHLATRRVTKHLQNDPKLMPRMDVPQQCGLHPTYTSVVTGP